MKCRAFYRSRYLIHSSKYRKFIVHRNGFFKNKLPNGTPLNQEFVRRKVYFASLAKGLSASQIEFVWQSASQQYSTFQIRQFFLPIMENAQHFVALKYDFCIPSGIGAVIWGRHSQAMQVLAQLSREKAKNTLILCIDDLCIISKIPWSDFTFVLLEKLNQDELLTGALCCNLLERDLGL